MTYNKKSIVEEMKGLSGDQRKISQTVHRQPDESSQVIHRQPDESSQVIHQDSDVIIPLLNFDSLGHNTNYQKQLPPPVHEMQNLTGTNLREGVGVVPDISVTKYKSEVAIIQDDKLTQGWMEFASVILYNYATSAPSDKKWTIERLKIPQMSNLYENQDNGKTLYPSIPVTFGWKKLQITNGASFFATNPIMLPVIKTVTIPIAETISKTFTLYWTSYGGGFDDPIVYYVWAIAILTDAEETAFFVDLQNYGFSISGLEFSGLTFHVVGSTIAGSYSVYFLHEDIETRTKGFVYTLCGSSFSKPVGGIVGPVLNPSLTIDIGGTTYTGRNVKSYLGDNFSAYGGLIMRRCIFPAVISDTVVDELVQRTWLLKDVDDTDKYRNIYGINFFDITYDSTQMGRDAFAIIVTMYRVYDDCFHTYCIVTQNPDLQLRFTDNLYILQMIGLGIYYISDITQSSVEETFPQVKTLIDDGGENYVPYYPDNAPDLYNDTVSIQESSADYPTNFEETDYVYPFVIGGTLYTRVYDGHAWQVGTSVITLREWGSYCGNYECGGHFYEILHGVSIENYMISQNNAYYPYTDTETMALRYIKVTPILRSNQFTLAFQSGAKWETYNSTGWYSQEVTSAIGLGQAEEPIMQSQVCIANRNEYSDEEIYDPALISGKLSKHFSAFLSTSGIEYDYKELGQSTSNAYDPSDITSITHTVNSGFGILSNKSGEVGSETENLSDVIIEGRATLTNLKIKRVYRISDTYSLTIVSFDSDDTTRYYIGVLNENNLRHYTPVNRFLSGEKIEISKIISHAAFKDRVALTVKTSNYSYYVSLNKGSNYPGSIFAPQSLKSKFILSVHVIDQDSETLLTNPESYTTESLYEYGVLTGDTSIKTTGIIEHDEFIHWRNPNTFTSELAMGTMVTKPTSLSMPNSIGYLIDTAEFAFYSVTIPLFSPSYMFGISGPDSISPKEDTEFQDENELPALYYRAGQVMLQNITKHNTPMNIFDCDRSVILLQLPSWDRTVNNYSLLPEKLTTKLRNEVPVDIKIGEKSFVINSKNYVHVIDNIYEASLSSLIRANNKPLLDISGTVYANGNIVCSANTAGTYIYQMDQYEGFVLVKTITGTLLCPPVSVSDDLAMICDNGIYTLKNDMIHEFDNVVEQAIIKPISGYGYFIFVESNEVTTYNFMVSDGAGDYKQFVEYGGENFSFDLLFTTGFYQLSNSLSISKIDRTIVPDIDTNYNGINSDDNSNYLQIYNTTETASTSHLDSVVYTLGYGSGITSTYYLETAPIIVQKQNAYQYFEGTTLLIEYEGTATVTVDIIRNSTTEFTSPSVTLDVTKNIEEVQLGSMLCDGLKLKVNIVPGTTAFRLLNMKLVGQLQEQNYEVV